MSCCWSGWMKEMATYRHWSVSLWRDPDDVSHCQILSPDKTEWRLISATLCGWRRYFMADQLWLMTRVWEEWLTPCCCSSQVMSTSPTKSLLHIVSQMESSSLLTLLRAYVMLHAVVSVTCPFTSYNKSSICFYDKLLSMPKACVNQWWSISDV